MTIQCPECGSMMVDKIHDDIKNVYVLICGACGWQDTVKEDRKIK